LAFTSDSQRLTQRKHVACQAQGLANAQTRTVKQQQQGPIARGNPRITGLFRHIFGQGHGIIRGNGAGQGFFDTRAFQPRDGLLPSGKAQKATHRRKLSRGRYIANAIQPPQRKVSPHICGIDARQIGRAALVDAQKAHQPFSRRYIGADRMDRPTPITPEMV
jgi:hypothetical protein